ncbi:MAG: hypothetical protein ACF8XB_03250 [Planctomycetota bacterium JB042]
MAETDNDPGTPEPTDSAAPSSPADASPPSAEGGAEGEKPRRTRRRVSHNMQTGLMLSRTFSVWGKNIGPFSLLALVISIPNYLWERYVAPDPDPSWLVIVAGAMLNWIVPMLVSATICHAVFQQLAGRPGGIGASVQVMTSRLPNVLGTSLVAALVTAVGYMALIIPGIIIGVMLFVAIPAAVVEKPGVFAALSRSSELTKGNRLAIFVLTILVGVLVMIPSVVLALVFDADGVAFMVAVALLGALVGSFSAVLQTVVYHDLRAGREGLDVQELADVFA